MYETIVAVFPTVNRAEDAAAALRSAGVPANEVSVRGEPTTSTGGALASSAQTRDEGQSGGFWDWLFGTSDYDRQYYSSLNVPERDRDLYKGSLGRGHGIVTVRASGDTEMIYDILERHDPIDLDTEEDVDADRAAGLSSSSQTKGEERVIPTAKEEVRVGKRQAGSAQRYRVRSYVLERPVEEDVHLRDERVTVERRAPGSGSIADGDPFEDKIIEVSETHEEPVVEKRVKRGEDVVVRKDVRDRVEKVHETVRETKVDVDRAAAGGKPGTEPLTGGPKKS